MASQSVDGRATSTVLLVEDEPGLLSLARRILERAGFHVIAHGDPEAALAWWNEHPADRGTVDLLLSDVMMPGLTGDSLLGQLRASRPDLVAILMSGNEERLSGSPLTYEFLGKPYTPTQLVTTVRQVLEDHPRAS